MMGFLEVIQLKNAVMPSALRMPTLALSVALSAVLWAADPSGDWPQFRGPTGDGISPAGNAPLTWSPTKNIAWKTAVPGRGRSSPVILGDRIWMTTAVEGPIVRYGSGADDMQKTPHIVLGAVCLDRATGKLLWHTEIFPWDDPTPVHWLNSFATPTPVVEPGRLHCDFGTYGTACVDAADGKIIWKRRLPLEHQVGPGSSPIIHKDLLILVRDGLDQQYVTALDTKTGSTVWKMDRPPMRTQEGQFRKSFSTPLVIESGGRVQMVVPGAQWVISYEPSTGREIWRVDDGDGFSAAPRPVSGNGMVYVCTGNTGGQPQLWAIRIDGQGDVTKTHVAWKLTSQVPMMPSPILVGQELYMVSDKGMVTCVDALSGKTIGRHRADGDHGASPVLASGRIYFFDEEGTAVVLKAGKDMVRLAENRLEGPLFATPAFADAAIYLRTDRFLFCIGN